MRRPIEAIVINGKHYIDGSDFEQGMTHDVDTGTVTITFANVQTLEVQYKDQQERS